MTKQFEILLTVISFTIVFILMCSIVSALEQSRPLIGLDDSKFEDLTGKGITICVVDTGVNYSSPLLGNCTSTEFLSGNCEKVVAGHNYCANEPNCNAESGDPMDSGDAFGHSHGTHVATILAANGTDSGWGFIQGVAPEAKIAAVRVFNSSGGGVQDDSQLAKGIHWCIENSNEYDISIISLSLGRGTRYTDNCTSSSSVVDENITRAIGEGIVVIAAAGNNGYKPLLGQGLSFPACVEGVISVGETYDTSNWPGVSKWISIFSLPLHISMGNYDIGVGCADQIATVDQMTCTSSRGTYLDVVAPGAWSKLYDGQSGDATGTSFATPHVSGIVALLQQFTHRARKPLALASE